MSEDEQKQKLRAALVFDLNPTPFGSPQVIQSRVVVYESSHAGVSESEQKQKLRARHTDKPDKQVMLITAYFAETRPDIHRIFVNMTTQKESHRPKRKRFEA